MNASDITSAECLRVETIAIRDIYVLNPRTRSKRLHRELIENIRLVGLKRPVTVSRHAGLDRAEPFDLICGQGRLEALAALGHTSVPAMVVEVSEEDCLVMSLVENVARRSHHGIDFMREVGRLRERGHSDQHIADIIGASPAWETKGEMIRECLDQGLLEAIAGRTVSCGKWKRSGQQCGKCVPCLIRRASFHAAGWQDQTHYKPPGDDLRQVLEQSADSDDLMAMILASRRLPAEDLVTWVAKTGPLPSDLDEQAALVDVVGRGMAEVRTYLDSEQLLQ